MGGSTGAELRGAREQGAWGRKLPPPPAVESGAVVYPKVHSRLVNVQ